MLGSGNCSPAMAVPMTVKMPEPITAPMPSAVRDHGPRLFLSESSGSSDSLMSLSIDLRASSWLGRAVLLKPPGAWICPRILSEELAHRVLSQNTVHLDGEEHRDRKS